MSPKKSACLVLGLKYFIYLFFFYYFCMLSDIDECVEEPAVCGPNSNCTNLIGSYNCTCVSGYRLNNPDVIASITNPCTGACSLIYFSLCDIHCTICMCACVCVYLFMLINKNKHTPKETESPVCFLSSPDIDECAETPGICGKNTVCTNVPGTFFCSCPDGLYPSTGILWVVGISFCQS